jgi:POT family proton-dependent oligopeptide transporter
LADLKANSDSLAFVVANLSYDQMSTNLISQALQMQTYGVPNDQLFNLNAIFVMILLPLWEKILSPYLRRFFRLGPIFRIKIGFIFVTLAMGYTLGVQVWIYKTAPCYNHPLTCPQHNPNKVHVAAQIPTYFLLAVSEIFTNVAGMEYAYTKAPQSMKSLVQAMFAFMWALGSICGIALSPLSQNPYLVILFAVLCGGMVLTTIFFSLCFKDDVNMLDQLGDTQKDMDKRFESEKEHDKKVVGNQVRGGE